GEQPFSPVVPFPDPQFFWGLSYVEALMPLQSWREARMRDIDELMEKALHPSRALLGIPGITEEKALALDRPRGVFFSAIPGGQVPEFKPQLPPDAFAEIAAIDQMFADQAGLPAVLSGGGGPEMRAGNQVGVAATIASGRVRKRALVVE